MGNKEEKTLLIVDDSSFIIERVLDSLKDHETVKVISAATDYDEAVELLASLKPDFLLLDIHLGDKSGIDMLKFTRKHYPETKVIMFSNVVDENYIRLCKELGAIYCLDKSKDFEQIPGILSSL